MRALKRSEKRTIRIAAVLLAVYAMVFYGVRGWQHLAQRKREYAALKQQVQRVGLDVALETSKAETVSRLKKSLRLDVDSLREDSVVAEALTAIQKAAGVFGVELGPSRELPGDSSSRELAQFHLQGKGRVDSVCEFLHAVGRLGYPIAIDSLNLVTARDRPGLVDLRLNIVVINIASWEENRA